MEITIVDLLSCFFEGSKPLEGAKKLVLFKEVVRSCTTKVRSAGQSLVSESSWCPQ